MEIIDASNRTEKSQADLQMSSKNKMEQKKIESKGKHDDSEGN